MNNPIKNWKLVINPQWPHESKVFYKGDLVGYVRHVNFGVDVDTPVPYLTFSIFTQDVDVETTHEPPPGL